jgi:hypothetical protein
MSPLHRTMAIAGHIGFLAVAVGLIVRRRWTITGFFTAYIAFALVVNPMIVWWPAQFYRQWFFIVMQTISDVLKFGITLEIGWRTFRPFPGARSTTLLTALVILTLTALAAASVPVSADASEWNVVLGHLFPRVKTGTIWLMAMTLILAHWYRVPVHPFRAAVLTSFAVYLGLASALAWAAGLGAGKAYGLDAETLSTIDIVADLLLVCYWVRAAWQPESATAIAHRETVRRIQTSALLREVP